MDCNAPSSYSVADFRARVARQPAMQPGDDYGDHRFNPGHPRLALANARLRDAAVLIPVIDRGTEATVLLTKRAASDGHRPLRRE